jgi:hypothetical protein
MFLPSGKTYRNGHYRVTPRGVKHPTQGTFPMPAHHLLAAPPGISIDLGKSRDARIRGVDLTVDALKRDIPEYSGGPKRSQVGFLVYGARLPRQGRATRVFRFLPETDRPIRRSIGHGGNIAKTALPFGNPSIQPPQRSGPDMQYSRTEGFRREEWCSACWSVRSIGRQCPAAAAGLGRTAARGRKASGMDQVLPTGPAGVKGFRHRTPPRASISARH